MKWIAGLVVLVTCLAPFYLNYNGYCWDTHRFITDEELIEAAIKSVISSNNAERTLEEEKWPIHYRDVDDFRRVNPECCQLRGHLGDDGPRPMSFTNRILGSEHEFVTVRWLLRSVSRDGRREDAQKAHYIYLNSCGKAT
jgi:hypothetical protein